MVFLKSLVMFDVYLSLICIRIPSDFDVVIAKASGDFALLPI